MSGARLTPRRSFSTIRAIDRPCSLRRAQELNSERLRLTEDVRDHSCASLLGVPALGTAGPARPDDGVVFGVHRCHIIDGGPGIAVAGEVVPGGGAGSTPIANGSHTRDVGAAVRAAAARLEPRTTAWILPRALV